LTVDLTWCHLTVDPGPPPCLPVIIVVPIVPIVLVVFIPILVFQIRLIIIALIKLVFLDEPASQPRKKQYIPTVVRI
jgi:hypothetical protein